MSHATPGDSDGVKKFIVPSARLLWVVLVLALPLGLLSCDPDPLQGRLVLSGSSTLAPVVGKAVDEWKKLHPRVEVRVETIGSEAGLDRLIRFRDADVALMSRPLVDQDLSAASARGQTLIPLAVGWDAVCVVVPQTNSWARSLTTDQTVRAFTTAILWSDLDPLWPGRPIHRFVLGPHSGTTDVFAVALLQGKKDLLFSAPGVQSSEDDKILTRGLAQVDGSIGFLGWASVQAPSTGLRLVALDGIEPSEATIANQSYGLPRKLWVVTTKEQANPAARSFLRFLYSRYEVLTAGSGLVPLTADDRRAVDEVLNTLN